MILFSLNSNILSVMRTCPFILSCIWVHVALYSSLLFSVYYVWSVIYICVMIICSVSALTAATHDLYATHSSVFVKVLWFKCPSQHINTSFSIFVFEIWLDRIISVIIFTFHIIPTRKLWIKHSCILQPNSHFVNRFFMNYLDCFFSDVIIDV